jgi:hypothetical protein
METKRNKELTSEKVIHAGFIAIIFGILLHWISNIPAVNAADVAPRAIYEHVLYENIK